VADGLLSGNGEGWDQFAANEKKYNVKSDYREELYTTKLDTRGMSKEQVCLQIRNASPSGWGSDLVLAFNGFNGINGFENASPCGW
jgi:hypothetical protein